MIDFLLSLSTWPGCALAMGFTTVMGLSFYLFSYKLISKYRREDIKEPTNNLFRVVRLDSALAKPPVFHFLPKFTVQFLNFRIAK